MAPSSGWSRTFDDPIQLPDGRELVTLRDAGELIAALPKTEQHGPQWATAIAALLLVVEHGDDIMLPRVAIMRALHRGKPSPEPTPRKKRVKKHRIIR
jgi:hypothetical protein